MDEEGESVGLEDTRRQVPTRDESTGVEDRQVSRYDMRDRKTHYAFIFVRKRVRKSLQLGVALGLAFQRVQAVRDLPQLAGRVVRRWVEAVYECGREVLFAGFEEFYVGLHYASPYDGTVATERTLPLQEFPQVFVLSVTRKWMQPLRRRDFQVVLRLSATERAGWWTENGSTVLDDAA
jgi:hypothetical protein